MTDNVNKPAHYRQGDIEAIDAIRAALTPEEFRGYCKGNVLKYVWRERHKGGTESLKKARWYLDRLVAEDEKQGVDRLCTKLKEQQPGWPYLPNALDPLEAEAAIIRERTKC